MEPKKMVIFIVIINVSFFSCKKASIPDIIESANVTIVIDPTKAEKVFYSQVFSNVEYIPIPTDSNFLVGEIDKMRISDNYVMLMDKYISRSVFLFEKGGNKRVRLYKEGQGPGEYVALKDIYFNKNHDTLTMLCGMRRKLLHYTVDGQFVGEQSIPYYVTRALPIDENYAFFSDYDFNANIEKEGNYPGIILSSLSGELIDTDAYFNKNIDKAVVYSSNPDFSSWREDTLSIKPDHSNVVYYVTNDSIYGAYKFDFGKYTLDGRYWVEVQKEGATVEKANELCYEEGLCETLRVLEDENTLFFKYKFKGEVNSVFYSKKTGKMFNIGLFWNDIDDITAFYPILLQDNKIYCVLSTEDIFTAKQYLTENKLLPEEILNNIKEFDNPVIVAFTLNNF